MIVGYCHQSGDFGAFTFPVAGASPHRYPEVMQLNGTHGVTGKGYVASFVVGADGAGKTVLST